MYKHISSADETLLKMYGNRTAANCAAYLLPHIKSSSMILDVGCGPGRITSDFARIATSGTIIGIDAGAPIIALASSTYPSSEFANLSFKVGDAYHLDFPDDTFDIVHCHQLLIHVGKPGPVEVLKEFQRVCKPGGIVAAREASTSVWSLKPESALVREHYTAMLKVTEVMGLNNDAGRKVEGWAKEAGFSKVKLSKSWLENPGFGEGLTGPMADKVARMGGWSQRDVDAWRGAWKDWETVEGREFLMECGEVLCWKAM